MRKLMTNVLAALTLATASAAATPALKVTPARFGALWHEQESPTVDCTAAHAPDAARRTLSVVVTDWQDKPVLAKTLGPLGAKRDVVFSPADLGGRFGAFKAVFTLAPAAAGGAALTAETWFARLTGTANPKPCAWVGTGIHRSHGWGRGDLRFLDILAAAGIGIVREEVGWVRCEKKKGEYKLPKDFADFLDGLVKRGIRINHVMSYTNPIYENPCDEDAFAAWCAWLARTCKGRIHHYEIWNEPQNFAFKVNYGGLDAPDTVWIDKFVTFTHKASDAILAVDPTATVAVTSEDSWKFLEDMLSKGIARKENLVSFHPYCHGQPRPEREMVMRDNAQALRKAMAAHGGATRYCVTEAGWTTYSGPGTYLAVAGGYPRASYVHQAQYLVRMYVLSRQLGCDYAIQYDFKNDGPNRGYTEHNFGMVFEDCTPKPALAATARLVRTLGEAKPLGDVSYDPAHFRVYRFARAGGETAVLWSIEGEREIPLPSEAVAKLRFSDLQGNPIPAPYANGKLRLTECPVYAENFDARLFSRTPRVEVTLPAYPRAVGGENFPIAVKFPETDGAPQHVTCRMSFDFGNGRVNEQTVAFPVGRIGALSASNVIRRDGTPLVPVIVHVNSPNVTGATVTASSPLLEKPVSAQVSCKPDLPGVWSLPLLRAPGPEGAEVTLSARYSNGMTLSGWKCRVYNAFVPKMKKTPSFTGKVGEWADAGLPTVRPVWVPGKLASAPSPADSTCEARVGWTEDGFLVLVKVHDDRFFQPFSHGREAVEADSLQVGYTRLYTSRCSKTAVAAFRDKDGAWKTEVRDLVNVVGGTSKVRAVYTPLSATEGVYEVLVPWSRLPTCRDSKTVRFAIRLNENDGEGLKGAWEIHGGVAQENGTGRFGTYSLD